MNPFILYDTEFTAWPGSQQRNWGNAGEYKEIIQLAALKVRFSDDQLVPLSSINVLVRPTINSRLSDYIIKLTGIEQPILDDHGIDFASCARQFAEFTHQGSIKCYSWGPVEVVLKENYRLNDLKWDFPDKSFGDLKSQLYNLGLDFRCVPSGGLANKVGVELDGHLHNALYDVKSIAAFLNQLLLSKKITQKQLHVAD